MLEFFGISSSASVEPSDVQAPDETTKVVEEEAEPADATEANAEVEADADHNKFDSKVRYTGTVNFFNKMKGYGFVNMDTKGLVPKDVVFVHWQSISSSDRYAFLKKGTEVEFNIHIVKGNGSMTHRAEEVTTPGGDPVLVQDEIDSQLKTFVGGKDLRYTGSLKFYDPKKGYGYITVDAGYQPLLDGAQLRVERAEVNAGGKQPLWMSNLGVEFGIWATTKGALKAYNMTLPGGIPLTQAALENRVIQDEQLYYGVVKVFNWKQGWGFIKLDQSTNLPPSVTKKLEEQAKQAQHKATSQGKDDGPQEELLYFRKGDVRMGPGKVDRGAKVSFLIYTDDKGAGAQEIQLVLENP